MALTKTVTTVHGITIERAYIRIDELSGNKEVINLRVRTYLDQLKCQNGSEWLQEELYSLKPYIEDWSDNFIKQGYEYLKSLNEFSGATDVLE